MDFEKSGKKIGQKIPNLYIKFSIRGFYPWWNHQWAAQSHPQNMFGFVSGSDLVVENPHGIWTVFNSLVPGT